MAGDASAEFLEWWTAAMVAYPETQRKAREELDEVVGRHRLLCFKDDEKVPYVAMVRVHVFARNLHNNLLKIDIISGKGEFAMGSSPPPGALYRSVQVICPHFDALKQTLRP